MFPETLSPFDQAIVVVFDQGFLSSHGGWRDVMALSSVNKAAYSNFRGRRLEKALAPLLLVLEKKLVACDGWPETLLEKGSRPSPLTRMDPRCDNAYNHWSKLQKCKAMTNFVAQIVQNVHQEFSGCFENPTRMPSFSVATCSPVTNLQIRALLSSKCTILALNIVALEIALRCMTGQSNNEKMLNLIAGKKTQEEWTVPISACRWINLMSPFHHSNFVDYLHREVYPEDRDLEVLGPSLVKKLVVAEPMFRWVPPRGKGQHKLDELDMEDIDSKARRQLTFMAFQRV